MTATTLAMKRPYPARNVVKTAAEARIFQGQMAKAKNSTRYCPRGMVRYLGNRSVTSLPNGIMFAAMLVPRMLNIQQSAARKMAARVPASQYLSRMASRRSHGFQSSRPQVLLMAAVDKMPSDAERVTAMGFVKS